MECLNLCRRKRPAENARFWVTQRLSAAISTLFLFAALAAEVTLSTFFAGEESRALAFVALANSSRSLRSGIYSDTSASTDSFSSCSASDSCSIKLSTSCGTGAFHTGAKDCRCKGEGPCSRSAAIWRGGLYPLLEASPEAGKIGSQSPTLRPRSTLAQKGQG